MVDKRIDIILEQWKICVEMANSVSARRDSMNSIFITLNLALIAAIAFIWNLKTLLLLVAGVVLCILWMLLIRNYRLLNQEKFKIINELEKMLPAKPFNDEWKVLSQNGKYKDSTKLEKCLPITFIGIYIISLIIIVINK